MGVLWAVCMAVVALLAVNGGASSSPYGQWRKLLDLVKEEPLVLKYHNGPLLTTTPLLNLHLLWYGKFTPAQRAIVVDFVQSLGMRKGEQGSSSVSTWWKTTEGYKGSAPSNSNPALGKQKVDETYSLGKSLKRSDIAALLESAVKSGALPPPETKKKGAELYL
ncbi:hypothetical protein KI387_032003, partial [Taxus chinensis]